MKKINYPLLVLKTLLKTVYVAELLKALGTWGRQQKTKLGGDVTDTLRIPLSLWVQFRGRIRVLLYMEESKRGRCFFLGFFFFMHCFFLLKTFVGASGGWALTSDQERKENFTYN